MISEKSERSLIERLKRKGIRVSRTEDILADELRKRKVPFRRQVKIGIYRVDFYIPSLVVVDVYGPHHEELRQSAWDMTRQAYLERRGLHVYILSASEVYESPGKYAELISSEYRKLKEEKDRSQPPESSR